ncbi:MAG: lysophospholipase [Nocardioidaceae bacterium]
MSEPRHSRVAGTNGDIVVHAWDHEAPTWVAVLVHGYGEHLGRYQHVAEHLIGEGATVVGPDHQGDGLSAGERVLVADYETVVDDLHTVVETVRQAHPGLPVVLIGHSMGGMIAARYAQVNGDLLAALVLSGPVLGSWHPTGLADRDRIPDDPLDVSALSRDPAVGEAYSADPLVWHGPFKRTTLRALATELATINDGGRLGALATLWVHGAADELVPIGPSRYGIERITGSDFTERVFDGARHEVFNETNRDEVLATVTAFVRRHI